MKKLLSILLVLVLCTSLMALTASAEGGYAMTVSSHKLKEGTKEVTVTVTFTQNAGIGALEIRPVYDAEVLKLTEIKGKGLPSNFDMVNMTGSSWMNSDTAAVWFTLDGDNTYTGEVVTMTFEVLQEQATEIKLDYDIANTAEESLTFDVTNGVIEFICEHKSGTDAKTTDATCDTEGKIEHICKKCGEVTKTETIKAKGHTKGEAVTENEVPATCETAGSKDTVVYCTVCEKEVSRKTETIKALGHTKGEAVTENEVPATCETAGSKDTVVYCTVCQKEVSRKTETIKALGHAWDEGKVTSDAKCGEPGVVTYTCKNDASHTKTEETGALAHAWGEGEVTTDPTCTEKGVKTYTCTRGCGETKTEEVAALGHTKAEAVKENEVAPTCEQAGSYDEVVYCSVCNVELSRKTVTVKATGHNWDEGTVTTEAKCYADGVMTYTCKNDETHTKTEAIKDRPAHSFTNENWSHEDKVYCIRPCDVEECNAVEKKRHNVLEWDDSTGAFIGTCDTCGQPEINKGDLIPAGDITPMLVMGGVAAFSILAAAAYVTYRKVAR